MLNKPPTEIQRLAALAEKVEALRSQFEPMPDAAMDALTKLGVLLQRHVMALPPTGMEDFSAKLRMIAAYTDNDDCFDRQVIILLDRCATDLEYIGATQFQGAAL